MFAVWPVALYGVTGAATRVGGRPPKRFVGWRGLAQVARPTIAILPYCAPGELFWTLRFNDQRPAKIG